MIALLTCDQCNAELNYSEVQDGDNICDVCHKENRTLHPTAIIDCTTLDAILAHRPRVTVPVKFEFDALPEWDWTGNDGPDANWTEAEMIAHTAWLEAKVQSGELSRAFVYGD